jgi:hypothetical protein
MDTVPLVFRVRMIAESSGRSGKSNEKECWSMRAGEIMITRGEEKDGLSVDDEEERAAG